ncbi:hypothetical protein [Rhizobium tubonense]|uniref:Uncharacterized protein n=1 Tax=Rhizobium tubonense TaxID=484088 RepID=A0A2W4CFS5_9HYPH|nr:hypothetical protein [Rhizobium tubonense]PZM09968.1 hypothetical protein CPY51_24220 [Rhizobium tubonense]
MNHVLLASGILLVAAPGAAAPTVADVPAIARDAVARRLEEPPGNFRIAAIKPSSRTPGYVVCGTIDRRSTSGGTGTPERFFVIVPGDFAILDRDGKDLLENYWSLNHC